MTDSDYAVLYAVSGYAFGRSSMLADKIPGLAAEVGAAAVLAADPFSLIGAAEFVTKATKLEVKPLVGASFEMPEGGEIVLVARTQTGFRSLSRLITECHLNEPRLFPLCSWERLERHREDLLCLTGGDQGPIDLLLIRGEFAQARAYLERLIGLYGRENLFVQIERTYLPWQRIANDALLDLAKEFRLVPVAGGAITHGKREHFPAQDVLVCIDTLCTIDDVVGRKPQREPSQPQIRQRPRRALNAERFFRPPDEVRALYADRPDLLSNTMLVAERCEGNVLPGRTELPRITLNDGATLREVTMCGALERHRRLSPALEKRLEFELNRIVKLGFAGHFLIAWDMCNWSRANGILLSGRGSVVDSAVAYCLGISRIDAFEHKLHFDRFLPADGSKRPDIDIDFEAQRRDDVRNYLADKYGRENVATVAAVGAFCSRGIVREVGKVMGLPEESVGFLAKRLHGGVAPDKLEAALRARPELRNSNIPKERFRWVFRLSERLMDIPRNIRAHSSGVIISSAPIADTVPVMVSGAEDVRIIQWDKRSAKRCFDKFDVLCLRGQDVLRGAQERIRLQRHDFDVQQVPLDDPETYRAMRSGQLIGIPQSASPAMRQAHVRIRTQNLTDASLVQAGIRPGVGGAVKINELIARRRGKPYEFNHPKLEEILGITYGIIVFQEQVDMLLQAFGGYTSGEAEDIRESIHKRRRENYASEKRNEIVRRVMSQGYSTSLAEEVYDLVSGFQGYGFAQGHALAFAEISVRSIWCQQNYPAEYFAAILDAQPAGYYGPATLANEARVRGVRMLPPDVNRSETEFTVEDVQSEVDPKILLPNAGIRIALSQIESVSDETRKRIVAGRMEGPYRSFFEFAARARPDRDELERLVLCGACDSLCHNRRALLWAAPKAVDYANLVASGRERDCLPFHIPEPVMEDLEDFSVQEKAVYERAVLGLDVAHHLMAFERERVAARGGITGYEASRVKPGTRAFVVGNPIRLRFPPTTSGRRVMFFDLEDETGLLNVTCFDDTYQKYGHAVICNPYVCVVGETQDRDGHAAFLAERIYPYEARLSGLPHSLVTADFLVG